MANNDQNGGPASSGFDTINQNVFGLTALVVALVALATTTLRKNWLLHLLVSP